MYSISSLMLTNPNTALEATLAFLKVFLIA
jgi:hypothetical protein